MTVRFLYYYVYLYQSGSPTCAAKYVEAVVGPFDNSADRRATFNMMVQLHGYDRVKAGTLTLHNFGQKHVREMFERCGVEIPVQVVT